MLHNRNTTPVALLLLVVFLTLLPQLVQAQEVLPTITPKPMPAGIVPAGFSAEVPLDASELAAIEQSLPELAEVALGLLNSERVRNGCAPLLAQPLLNGVALAHSRDMARNNYFSHSNLQGQGPGTRATEAGYPWMRYAENIAAGYSTAQGVVDGWLASQGHRANLLNCAYTETGLAVFYEPSSTYLFYWTHDLATRRPGAELPTVTPTTGPTPAPQPTATPAPPSEPPDQIEIPTEYQVRLPIVMGR